MEKALLLLSGGIDSPVAGILKKDFELQAIHFSQEPFTDNTPEQKSLASAKKLGIKKLLVVNAGEELQKIAEKSFREYYFVLMKIFFMQVSEKIAQKKEINYLITGESIGQVSSQTISNLNTINSQVKIEILRPLLFFSKQEIIDISIKEGFFEISSGKEMCDVLASGKPRTKTSIEKVKLEMEKCKMDELVERALKKIVEKIICEKKL
jgi:tRNA uracil 4-sulfurtransferase